MRCAASTEAGSFSLHHEATEASLTHDVAVEIDINIGLLAEVLGDPRLPVARIDEIDNAQRDIIDMLLIVFAKQTPAFGTPRRQWISRSDVLRGGA
jgi:hypothetical protein